VEIRFINSFLTIAKGHPSQGQGIWVGPTLEEKTMKYQLVYLSVILTVLVAYMS
jgi:hypothetical protein